MSKVLIIDDENQFRESLSERLKLRGYENLTLDSGKDALKTVRSQPDIDVVILDRKMPGMTGEQVLKEIKGFRPELMVIMLTGYGDTASAVEAGKLDAFTYLQKPCELDKIVEFIDKARQQKVKAMEKHEIPNVEKGSALKWLMGSHNSRPGFIMLGILIFAAIVFMPTPQTLNELLTFEKTTDSTTITDISLGYSEYGKMKQGEYIAYTYLKKNDIEVAGISGKKLDKKEHKQEIIEGAEFRAKVMLAVLIVAALFWASGAIPIGITSLFVGVAMYFFGVLKPNDVASAFAKDSVIFIFGVLAMAVAIHKTGLDRRIGLLLMGSAKSLKIYLFFFLPMFGMACSFLSEHALVAFMMPILMIVYATATQAAGVKEDYKLAITLVLALNFAANCGGPGSPAAGGRNAVMLGILSDYGVAPTFGQWVIYGLPFVPIMCICIGLYFYIVNYRKLQVKDFNLSIIVKQAADKIGPWTQREYFTAAILIILITLWITTSETFGLGGPVILAIVLLNFLRILAWRDVSKIQWEVVALYAAATAMGKGLAVSGAALFLAKSFVDILPDYFSHGSGLAIAASLFTGFVTNFMSDGATVSALGPITVPMAKIATEFTHPWMVGLATAFASSFAHMFVIGTPNNAIVFTMAKNPITGEQLIKLSDFVKYGLPIWIISMLVLWFWTIIVYWGWLGFPTS